MPNRLSHETSPYLLQHADNPVDWHPWGEEALTLSRETGKPILLSIGYSACHWCHVMAHESFEDAEVAAVMNHHFINVKVDREERPDLDQIYQLAHQMLARQHGGWPLTMFLAPNGEPFYSGTYFPRTPRYRMPGFIELCEWVAKAWQEQQTALVPQGQKLRAAMEAMAPPPGGLPEDLDAHPIALLRQQLSENFDPNHGGIGGAPKFPRQSDIALQLQSPDTRQQALTTLRKMAEGGIYDQLGGGFCRYSVDERWEIPHFEKMLYDNGPLLSLYADAWALTKEPLFARVVDETAAWVMREMQSPEGGYYSSLDADSEGHEGKFYVWKPDEIRDLLTEEEWQVAAPHWGLDLHANFEGTHWHLKVAQALPRGAEALLATARQKLFDTRKLRIHPGRDDKILTSWNALMIEGMAHAARVFERPEWLASARRAANFIQRTLWDGSRLLATYKDGRAHLNAYLDDHAFLLSALIELMQAEFRSEDLAFAQALADSLLANFEDTPHGGFFFTRHDHETLIQRPKPGHENPMPSGNGIAALALQRLGHMLGNQTYLSAAERTLALFSVQFYQQPSGFSSMMLALAEWLTPPTIVVLRGPMPALKAWQLACAQLARPASLTLALTNGTPELPETLSMKESEEVTAWVCSGTTCRPPITELDALLQLLQEETGVIDSEAQNSPR